MESSSEDKVGTPTRPVIATLTMLGSDNTQDVCDVDGVCA
ncbi:hypothetical protein J2S57_005905 [Kineosporia succinea]|uniref:FxLD family lantipeptide n=1 Tax=Kineosporia succinea TaxID=84632 RepID=A0ABT9PBS5_9ACTN|nr:hypothetical protein [Kineosporia succinea]